MAAPLKLGPPVEGREYFHRPDAEKLAWDLVGTGHDLLLLDPRRVGKTSFLRRLSASSAHSVAELSVESAFTEAQIVAEIYRVAAGAEPRVAAALGKGQLRTLAGRILKVGAFGCEVELADLVAKGGWQALGEELLAALNDTGDWLILLDELPLALRRLAGLGPSGDVRETPEGVARVEQLLAWLRHARQRPGTRVRWVLAGSIGLDTLARRWGLSEQVQDLRLLRLGALPEEDAERFVAWAAERLRLRLEPAAGAEIVRAVGWPIPFHLGLVIQELADRRATGSAAEIELALGALLERDRRTHFDPWDQRLDRQFTPSQASLARRLLAAVCRDPRGSSIPHLRLRLEPDFAFVADALIHDGYLVEVGSRLQFRSPLLRRWWQRHGSRS